MSTQSPIEWTEQTLNVTTGCTKVSPGCKNCYALTMAKRLQAMGAKGYDNGFELSLMPGRMVKPIMRKKPTLYFVNSMSDLFHEEIPDDFLDRVFTIMALTTQHTFQILTKRSQRMRQYFAKQLVPSNVWLGVSVEDRSYGLPRIADLRTIDAPVRFLSCEPLLEDLGTIDLNGIHQVIVGGESGPGARRMHPPWVDHIKEQCHHAGAAFFFKQWGAFGADGKRRSKKTNGRVYQGRTWDEMPAHSTHQMILAS